MKRRALLLSPLALFGVKPSGVRPVRITSRLGYDLRLENGLVLMSKDGVTWLEIRPSGDVAIAHQKRTTAYRVERAFVYPSLGDTAIHAT